MDMRYESDVLNGIAAVNPYSHPHFSLGLALSLKEKEDGSKMKSPTQITMRTALEHKDQVNHEFRVGWVLGSERVQIQRKQQKQIMTAKQKLNSNSAHLMQQRERQPQGRSLTEPRRDVSRD